MTDDAMTLIADIHERLQQHIEQHGEPQKRDRQIWRLLDQMDEQAVADMITFARDNQYWDDGLRDWVREVANRQPFWIRQKRESDRTTNNNTNLWRCVMLMREVIEARLKYRATPAQRLFEHT